MRDVDLNYEAECILYHAMNNCVREKKNQRPGAADQTIHGARCGPCTHSCHPRAETTEKDTDGWDRRRLTFALAMM